MNYDIMNFEKIYAEESKQRLEYLKGVTQNFINSLEFWIKDALEMEDHSTEFSIRKKIYVEDNCKVLVQVKRRLAVINSLLKSKT